ncbi:MAG: RsmB/NOP family class I SAM-dependent RNA methyltransferase, partial [Desulfovibrionaceae bacterium]|nr:RsmB/NOP family class I SAM-dependent RNA methyltransferase [Desulfovibrionaceae bacterium]
MRDRQRSFRIARPGREAAVLGLLSAQGFESEAEPFLPLARRLVREPFALGSSLAARFGLIYIQDRSSMLPPLALDPGPGAAVLDMCAAPGGKTGLLACLVGPRGFVLGLEPSMDRLETLRRNLRRTGAANAATARARAERLDYGLGSWEFALLDPPCSGWGTADKNPRVLDLWTGDKIAPLADLQRVLLRRAADLLSPGGRLVYSTCTTNKAENEDQVIWAASELGLDLERLAAPPGFETSEPLGLDGVLRVGRGPGVGGEAGAGQGFFVARLKK